MGLTDGRDLQTTCGVAIVGAGNMASEHIRAFADVPWVTVTGIHSRTRSGAEALAASNGIPAVCDSVAELYETTQASLVVVAVSETATCPVSQDCFEFPWTVLLEKPPGLDLTEAEVINAAASARSRNVLVALNRRFLSSTRAASADLARCDGRRFIKVQDQQDLGQAADVVQDPRQIMGQLRQLFLGHAQASQGGNVSNLFRIEAHRVHSSIRRPRRGWKATR